MAASLFVVTSFAQDSKPPAAAQPVAVSQIKSKAMQERQAMMDKTKTIGAQAAGIRKSLSGMDYDRVAALDAQVIELQRTVGELQEQLAKEPRYFDNPQNDPLRP